MDGISYLCTESFLTQYVSMYISEVKFIYGSFWLFYVKFILNMNILESLHNQNKYYSCEISFAQCKWMAEKKKNIKRCS